MAEENPIVPYEDPGLRALRESFVELLTHTPLTPDDLVSLVKRAITDYEARNRSRHHIDFFVGVNGVALRELPV